MISASYTKQKSKIGVTDWKNIQLISQNKKPFLLKQYAQNPAQCKLCWKSLEPVCSPIIDILSEEIAVCDDLWAWNEWEMKTNYAGNQ